MSVALRILGSAYLLYLAYRVATAGNAEKAETSKPFTFWEAAAFQYVNPKAWVMTVTAAGSFLRPEEPLVRSVLLMTTVFGAVNLPSIIVWAGGGTMMGRLLSDDRTRRVVNGILGLLLVWTVWLINQ
jgi:threonine/homoserine/homoserine lactone efflux protein